MIASTSTRPCLWSRLMETPPLFLPLTMAVVVTIRKPSPIPLPWMPPQFLLMSPLSLLLPQPRPLLPLPSMLPLSPLPLLCHLVRDPPSRQFFFSKFFSLIIGIPAPPPLPFSGGQTPAKKPVVSTVPLPMLNWLPIKNPEHTIFKVSRHTGWYFFFQSGTVTLQDMDDENIIETVDFSEFERLFQVKRSKKQRLKRQDEGKKHREHFLSNSKKKFLTCS